MKKKQRKRIKSLLELITKAIIGIAALITAITQLIEALK